MIIHTNPNYFDNPNIKEVESQDSGLYKVTLVKAGDRFYTHVAPKEYYMHYWDRIVEHCGDYSGRGFYDHFVQKKCPLPGAKKIDLHALEKSTPKWRKDPITGKTYLNESEKCIRKKCLLLMLANIPVISFICTLIQAALTRKPKLLQALIPNPVTTCFLMGAAIYGIINPYKGRATYSQMEKQFYGQAVLAPCFQPNATRHFFGSPISQKDGV